jgi:flagellar basal-body rod protein FlgF
MSDVLAISLKAMQGDMARVQQISMNMANALTPGYKRGVPVQAPMLMPFAQALEAAQAEAGTGAASRVHADMRPGTLKRTNHSLDVALAGDGYFEVVTENGPAYTRQGSFQVDARGRLVTGHGLAVMGRDGEIHLGISNPAISKEGVITDPAVSDPNAAPLGVLKLVHFEAGVQLDSLGNGLLSAPAAAPVKPDGRTQVQQGFLENSNVSSAQEMTQLMQAMRHFEGMHKVALAHDEMLGTAIRKLGETG